MGKCVTQSPGDHKKKEKKERYISVRDGQKELFTDRFIDLMADISGGVLLKSRPVVEWSGEGRIILMGDSTSFPRGPSRE